MRTPACRDAERGADRAHVTVCCALALVLLLWGAGCDSGTDAPLAESTLFVGISTDVANWSSREFPGGDARFVWSQVYETLVRLTPDLQVEPGLAVSWSQAQDGRSWDFHLRQGVTFHDGSPFTAQAVVFSYSPDSYSRRTVLRPVEAVEAVGDHWVRFRLRRPMPLPYYLTHVGWPVMAPHCVDAEGRFVRPIGTGPFQFESQAADREIVLSRNTHYWGKVPAVSKVVFKVVPAAPARVISLEAGELDMIVKVPESDVSRLERLAGVRVHRRLSTFTDFIQFNCRRVPFSELDLRRAVAYVIDTRKLVRDLLDGVGQPARGRPFSPVMLYSNPELKLYERDPARARRLMAEAGWKDTDGDGTADKERRPLCVTLLVTQNANVAAGGRFFALAEAVQAALKEIGMHVTIRQLEGGAFLRAERKGEFDMLLRTGFYVWGNYPRHFFLHQSDNLYSHFDDPAFDKLIRAADAATETAAQQALYERLQREALRLLPGFYLAHQEKVVATRSWVEGYELSAEAPWLNLKGVYLRQSRRKP